MKITVSNGKQIREFDNRPLKTVPRNTGSTAVKIIPMIVIITITIIIIITVIIIVVTDNNIFIVCKFRSVSSLHKISGT